MATESRSRRLSITSDSSISSSPERGADDDAEDSVVDGNDSQSSLSVSLREMELDTIEYERRRRQSPICRLPAELLIAVFSKLSSPGQVKNCMLVCKSWATNSVDLLWHRPSTSSWKHLLNVIHSVRKTNGFFAYQDLVRRLNLGSLKEEVSDGTLQPLSICKRIERLTLPGCKMLTDLSVADVIEGNRALLAVDVSELDQITDRSLFAVANNCYKLQGLNITSCKRVTDMSLVAVAKNCRRVKRLKFNDCPQLTDFSILAFADNCHDILEIDLYKCINVTDSSITAILQRSRQLRELRLAQCSRITDEAFLSLHQADRFEGLRILDLTDCNELNNPGLQRIVQAAPRLRNLVLAKCRNISDAGVLAITKLGKNLHFLHLGHCASITDYGVSHLVRYCNRIRYIDFSCCTNLTDESVSLLATLPRLKRIGLVKCGNITDRSIRALAAPKRSGFGLGYHPNNLERLHLSYCTHLTIQGIRTLLINCPQLTHLSLTGVHPFLREDLLAFCRDAPDEFNEHQRDVFCVFSGEGVEALRKWLQENYMSPIAADLESFEDTFPNTLGRHVSTFPPETMQGHHTIVPFPHHQFPFGAALQSMLPQPYDAAPPPSPDPELFDPDLHLGDTGGDVAQSIPPPPPPLIPTHTAPTLTAADDAIDEDLDDGNETMGGL
ncbi:MAG: SCF ubiquitin ligase complex subunit [Chrysothrix sp. TS-e1954]|nr:MAG: SCF ubiquitin ligase complex subunit [Chrysothrix sp. TS-e1954]